MPAARFFNMAAAAITQIGDGASNGSDLYINSSFGSFGDGGVSVGNSGMTVADQLTVDGSFVHPASA
jgi:hypothetical protein